MGGWRRADLYFDLLGRRVERRFFLTVDIPPILGGVEGGEWRIWESMVSSELVRRDRRLR